MYPGHSLDYIPKHNDDKVLIVTSLTSKEPIMTLLIQSANAAPTELTRITVRSMSKANQNVQYSIHKKCNEDIGKHTQSPVMKILLQFRFIC